MSYSEENGQVVLRMSPEDYALLCYSLGSYAGQFGSGEYCKISEFIDVLLNRLNEGNPNYTPYQVPEKK